METPRKKSFQFTYVTEEGEPVWSSNPQARTVYEREVSAYYSAKRACVESLYEDEPLPLGELWSLPTEPPGQAAERKRQGELLAAQQGFRQWQDDENNYASPTHVETPRARITTRLLDQRLDFSDSDGVCREKWQVTMTLK